MNEEENLREMLVEVLDGAEKNAEKLLEYSTLMLAMRRRIRNALTLLGEGRAEEAKVMLEQALADDGGFIKRRLDKITQDVIGGLS